ncbi:hypothetical protein TNCV_101761 [Trichonephila clavipes]|nr:hypothetical protein TNCV_101761 [Trichonephila clavipes]
MAKYGSCGIKYLNTGFRKALVAPCVGRFRIPMYSRDRLHRWIKDHLDFDRKSLAIPDSQINKVVKKVEIEKVEIDLSKTKLEEKQKRELQDLFNSFQGLFSDKPGLTHVLYHEIDTGDNPPIVSRPYRYDRLKQEILDYHVDKMLKEGKA